MGKVIRLKTKITRLSDSIGELEELGIDSFAKEYKKIRKLVGSESRDFASDAATEATLRSLLSMFLTLLPLVESNVKRTSGNRGIYGVVALSSAIRELLHDLRQIGDSSQRTQDIMLKIIEPNLSATIQHLSTDVNKTKKLLVAKIKNPELKQLASKLLRKILREQISQISIFREIIATQIKARLES